MRFPLILGLIVLSVLPSRADDTAQLTQAQEEQLSGPAPQLMHLERSLMQKQDARDKGELPPEKYQEFVATFRVELDAVLARVPASPENKGLHAQILARLGEQERGQALASLEQALADDSENAALLVAKGSILHERQDFPAAAELARQAWEVSGRKDQRAWALLKMSEGRISGARSGDSAAQLRPASDFAKLDWSIPENHDINPQALGLIRQATAARRRFDMAETWRYAQAAMNADPTSRSVQKIYEKYKADQSRHAVTLTYVEQAAAAIAVGRGAEGVAWAQRAYDRSPSDDTYGILQDVRRRSAELDVKRAAEPPAKAPASEGSSPLLPIMLLTGAGFMAYGAFKIAKSKDTRVSDDGINPDSLVSSEQARRNYVNSAVIIATPIVMAGLVFGGPIVWRATAPAAGAAFRGGQELVRRLASSEAGAINPSQGVKTAAKVGDQFVAASGRINPHAVRFTQDSISYRMRDAAGTKAGQTIDEMAEALAVGKIRIDDIPPIRLVLREGKLFTLDNRRLEAFRRAKLEIPYRMATQEEIQTAVRFKKFSTVTEGTSIGIRGQ